MQKFYSCTVLLMLVTLPVIFSVFTSGQTDILVQEVRTIPMHKLVNEIVVAKSLATPLSNLPRGKTVLTLVLSYVAYSYVNLLMMLAIVAVMLISVVVGVVLIWYVVVTTTKFRCGCLESLPIVSNQPNVYCNKCTPVPELCQECQEIRARWSTTCQNVAQRLALVGGYPIWAIAHIYYVHRFVRNVCMCGTQDLRSLCACLSKWLVTKTVQEIGGIDGSWICDDDLEFTGEEDELITEYSVPLNRAFASKNLYWGKGRTKQKSGYSEVKFAHRWSESLYSSKNLDEQFIRGHAKHSFRGDWFNCSACRSAALRPGHGTYSVVSVPVLQQASPPIPEGSSNCDLRRDLPDFVNKGKERKRHEAHKSRAKDYKLAAAREYIGSPENKDYEALRGLVADYDENEIKLEEEEEELIEIVNNAEVELEVGTFSIPNDEAFQARIKPLMSLLAPGVTLMLDTTLHYVATKDYCYNSVLNSAKMKIGGIWYNLDNPTRLIPSDEVIASVFPFLLVRHNGMPDNFDPPKVETFFYPGSQEQGAAHPVKYLCPTSAAVCDRYVYNWIPTSGTVYDRVLTSNLINKDDNTIKSVSDRFIAAYQRELFSCPGRFIPDESTFKHFAFAANKVRKSKAALESKVSVNRLAKFQKMAYVDRLSPLLRIIRLVVMFAIWALVLSSAYMTILVYGYASLLGGHIISVVFIIWSLICLVVAVPSFNSFLVDFYYYQVTKDFGGHSLSRADFYDEIVKENNQYYPDNWAFLARQEFVNTGYRYMDKFPIHYCLSKCEVDRHFLLDDSIIMENDIIYNQIIDSLIEEIPDKTFYITQTGDCFTDYRYGATQIDVHAYLESMKKGPSYFYGGKTWSMFLVWWVVPLSICFDVYQTVRETLYLNTIPTWCAAEMGAPRGNTKEIEINRSNPPVCNADDFGGRLGGISLVPNDYVYPTRARQCSCNAEYALGRGYCTTPIIDLDVMDNFQEFVRKNHSLLYPKSSFEHLVFDDYTTWNKKQFYVKDKKKFYNHQKVIDRWKRTADTHITAGYRIMTKNDEFLFGQTQKGFNYKVPRLIHMCHDTMKVALGSIMRCLEHACMVSALVPVAEDASQDNIIRLSQDIKSVYGRRGIMNTKGMTPNQLSTLITTMYYMGYAPVWGDGAKYDAHHNQYLREAVVDIIKQTLPHSYCIKPGREKFMKKQFIKAVHLDSNTFTGRSADGSFWYKCIDENGQLVNHSGWVGTSWFNIGPNGFSQAYVITSVLNVDDYYILVDGDDSLTFVPIESIAYAKTKIKEMEEKFKSLGLNVSVDMEVEYERFDYCSKAFMPTTYQGHRVYAAMPLLNRHLWKHGWMQKDFTHDRWAQILRGIAIADIINWSYVPLVFQIASREQFLCGDGKVDQSSIRDKILNRVSIEFVHDSFTYKWFQSRWGLGKNELDRLTAQIDSAQLGDRIVSHDVATIYGVIDVEYKESKLLRRFTRYNRQTIDWGLRRVKYVKKLASWIRSSM